MANPPIRLTQERVRNLTPPDTGRDEIRDAVQNSLYLRITDKGIKTWRVTKRSPQTGKVEHATLGRWPDISVDQARLMAQRAILEIIEGRPPAAAKRRQKVLSVTLSQTLDDYLKKPQLTARTQQRYRAAVHNHLADWLNLPLNKIDEQAIKTRHQAIGQTSPGAANFAMTVFTALWNHARNAQRIDGQPPALGIAPTDVLARQKLRFPGEIKENRIPRAYLRDWFKAVQALSSPAHRDYLMVLILSGMRMDEARSLRWTQIDWKANTLTLPDPKNHRPHILPLTGYLHGILTQRKKTTGPEWVFQSQTSRRISKESIYQAEREVSAAIDYEFRSHCLRKTFGSEAEQLGIGSYVVARLLNHKAQRGDVTARYIVLDGESLRTPMETITRHFLTEFGVLDAPADAPPAR